MLFGNVPDRVVALERKPELVAFFHQERLEELGEFFFAFESPGQKLDGGRHAGFIQRFEKFLEAVGGCRGFRFFFCVGTHVIGSSGMLR